MDSGERVPCHQIHPAKLATNIGASLVSTDRMWRGWLVAAKLAAFVPQDGQPCVGDRWRGVSL
jgi:hypothetical protein